jgi:hypothetical protein
VLEAPDVRCPVGPGEPIAEAELLVLAGDERKWRGRPVAEPDVDEPLASVRCPRGQPEVVRVRARPLLSSSLDACDMTRDVDLEPGQERRERAVEVVAVAASAADDARHGVERIDSRWPPENDVQGLVRDVRDVRGLESTQRVGVHTTRTELALEQIEVGARETFG